MRSKQRNKRKHKKEMEPSLKKWHATFRGKCIQTGSEDPSYDQKWGCYQSGKRLNVNQNPHPFAVYDKKTYEYILEGEESMHNTWISQPGPGLEERQCSLQVMLQPEGEQSKLAIILQAKESAFHKMKNQSDTKVSMYTFNQVLRWTRMYVRVGVKKHSFHLSRSKNSINLSFC